mmetsp:Transcript_11381/g.12791  ORF Transcript_11381/g.12791 Transcript_11381/m.12791 type:complete len:427 (-) Transcript_11381:25-1305(-)
MNANTVPLQEVLPWSPEIPRNILICDSIETDGGFILSTMVAQLFSSSSWSLPLPSSSASLTTASAIGNKNNRRHNKIPTRALWISGNTSTEQQVASSLKKMGCDVGAPYLRKEYSGDSNLTIRSLAVEIADRILRNQVVDGGMEFQSDIMHGNDEDKHTKLPSEYFDRETYLKQLYEEIKAWINYDNHNNTENNKNDNDVTRDSTFDDKNNSEVGPSWIILDDVTALASILGETLVYCFVESVVSLLCQQSININDTSARSTTKCGLIIRCSGDVDQMSYKIGHNEGNDHSGWIGAGGLAHKKAFDDMTHLQLIPWERALEESVDAIVDVLPLSSGFSREAHGRLIFSETPNGRGWGRKFQQQSNNNKSNIISASQSRTARHRSMEGPMATKIVPTSSDTNNNWNKLIFNYSIQDNGARAIRLRAG